MPALQPSHKTIATTAVSDPAVPFPYCRRAHRHRHAEPQLPEVSRGGAFASVEPHPFDCAAKLAPPRLMQSHKRPASGSVLLGSFDKTAKKPKDPWFPVPRYSLQSQDWFASERIDLSL